MKLASNGKIDENGAIFSNELITEKEGYEAMLYVLMEYLENSGSNDLTDILSGGEYFWCPNVPADSAFWEYWLKGVEKVKKEGSPPLRSEK
ncbi:MAG: hypothetical protein LBG67_03970 [Campylobacteraceae bacterium]|jgi:hypothetical protein|nr:hypothetical protein [Campylobacteraceae bacterium]